MTKMKFQDLLADWQSLLTALREDGSDIPQLDIFRKGLEDVIENIRIAKNLQLTLRAASRQATRHLAETLAKGRDEAIRTRAYLKGCLGARNERLARFGITPLRQPRPRRPDPRRNGG